MFRLTVTVKPPKGIRSAGNLAGCVGRSRLRNGHESFRFVRNGLESFSDSEYLHSGPFYGIEIRRTEFYLAPLLQNVIHIYCTFELSGRAPIFTSIFERSYSEIRTLRGKGGYTGVDIERIPSS